MLIKLSKPEIYFFSEEIKFVLPHKKKIREWISYAIKKEKRKFQSFNFIFCSDSYLIDLNKHYLQHNFYTDIITFDNSESVDLLSGDFYISIDRIKENSRIYSVPVRKELYRVIIHGVLHLIGYNDKTSVEAEVMKQKEDYYLSLLPKFIPGKI